jgi:central glycolytic genes regulator
MSSLREQNAVSEAFGYYFNDQGQIVHRVQHIGFQLEKAHQIEHIIAVAGGRSKARAILSFIKYGFHDILVTDEGAARELLEILAKED